MIGLVVILALTNLGLAIWLASALVKVRRYKHYLTVLEGRKWEIGEMEDILNNTRASLVKALNCAPSPDIEALKAKEQEDANRARVVLNKACLAINLLKKYPTY